MSKSDKHWIILISSLCTLILLMLWFFNIAFAQSAGFGDICNWYTGTPYINFNPDLIANPIYASGIDYDGNANGCSWLLLPFSENDYRTPLVPISGVNTEYVQYSFVAKAPITDTVVTVQLNYVDNTSTNHPVVFDIPLANIDGWQSFNIDFDGFENDIGGMNSFVSMQFRVSDSQSDVWIDKIRMLAFEPSTATPTSTVPVPTPTPTPSDCSNQFFYLDDFIAGYDWQDDGIANIENANGPPDTLEASLAFDASDDWFFWTFALSQTIQSDVITITVVHDAALPNVIYGFHPLAGRTSPYAAHHSGVGVNPNSALDATGWQQRFGAEYGVPPTNAVITDGWTISTFLIGVKKTTGSVPDNRFLDGVVIELDNSGNCQSPATPTSTPTSTLTPTLTTTPTTTATPTDFPIPTSTTTPQPQPISTSTLTPIAIATQTPNATGTSVSFPTIPAPGTPFPIPTPIVGGSCNVETPGNYDFCFDYGFTELDCWIIIPTISIISFPGFRICFELYGVVLKIFGFVVPTYLIVVAISFIIIWRWIL